MTRYLLTVQNLTRDLGRGFKATYELRDDGGHRVRFFRYGRRVKEMVFRPAATDDALRVFMVMKSDDLLKTA